MKLYTEEQLRKAHQNGRHGGNNENWHDTESYINSLIPIELPSDNDIDIYVKSHNYDDMFENLLEYGAKWMRDKIINQIK